MDANRDITTAGIAVQTETERVAARLLLALDAAGIGGTDRARDAERHAARLRFALDHVDELRRQAVTEIQRRAGPTGGVASDRVFVLARVEVAVSILETHVLGAARFLGIIRRPRTLANDAGQMGELTTALNERAA
jgi:hypothetical protein